MKWLTRWLGPDSPLGCLSGVVFVLLLMLVVFTAMPPLILAFRWWWHVWLPSG